MSSRFSAKRRLKHGAVAQLGERLICIQEVAGSIPTSSTSSFGKTDWLRFVNAPRALATGQSACKSDGEVGMDLLSSLPRPTKLGLFRKSSEFNRNCIER